MSSEPPPVEGIRYRKTSPDHDNDGLFENLRDHPVCSTYLAGNLEQSKNALRKIHETGLCFNIRDRVTGETVLHVWCESPHLYTVGLSYCYLQAFKTDLDLTDLNGDTVLHKVCRQTGGWPCIMALFRCGASPLVRNKQGRTPGEEILYHKRPGWEENLHWYNKFYPGLWAAVTASEPDRVVIERLLRYWCRTSKVVGRKMQNLKTLVQMKEANLDLICILEKYENTNEMALAMLSGKGMCYCDWADPDVLAKINVNTKDHAYQYHWRDYPTAPRPLLAALWSMSSDVVRYFLELKPDTAVKFTFESESQNLPKPLFFQLVNPKCRPESLENTSLVLQASDLDLRNVLGQTVLVEALYARETRDVIQAILDAGVNVAARDANGLTARDHAQLIESTLYRTMLDDYVMDLITSGDSERLQTMILQLYDHVTLHQVNQAFLSRITFSKTDSKIRHVLSNARSVQDTVQELFAYAEAGSCSLLKVHAGPLYGAARNKAGCSLLLTAVQHCRGKSTDQGRALGSLGDQCPSGVDRASEGLADLTIGENNEDEADVIHLYKSSSLDTFGKNCLGMNRNPAHNKSCSWNMRRTNEYNLLASYQRLAETDVEVYGEEDSSTNINAEMEAPQTNHGHQRFRLGALKKVLQHARRSGYWQPPTGVAPEPDHVGTVEFLLRRYPEMVHTTNNLGQTALHYAHIFEAGKDVMDLLRSSGSDPHARDVFEMEPQDYSRELHGDQTHHVRRQPTADLDLNIFLQETNFRHDFHAAIKAGDVSRVKPLVSRLLKLGGESRFRSCLFDCLDYGHFDLASYLVRAGFCTDVCKQYEACDPDNPMCAMMECDHHVISLRQMAVEVGATTLVALIDKESAKGENCRGEGPDSSASRGTGGDDVSPRRYGSVEVLT